MDQINLRRELPEVMRKKIIETNNYGKRFMAICKSFPALMLQILLRSLRSFKVYGSVGNPYAHGFNKKIVPSFNGRIVWKTKSQGQL